MVNAFEGNKAETTTMLRVIHPFQKAHNLTDVTVVADAGMVSAANQKAIEAAGLSFILGARIPEVPYVVKTWRAEHPDQEIPDGHVFTQPWPAGPADKRTTRSATTSSAPTGPDGPCVASMSRPAKPNAPWPGRWRSSGTGSSSSPAAPGR